MFIAVNTIKADADVIDQMKETFRTSAPEMDELDGFLGFELWQDEDGALLAISRWASKDAFDQYPGSEMFRRHHKNMARRDLESADVDFYSAETIV